MRDHKVPFLQISGGNRPSQTGPVFENDILKIGIGAIGYGNQHNWCFMWVSLVFRG